MLSQMAMKISSFFIAHEVIKKDDKAVYQYSFEVLLATIMNFLALYAVAIVTDTVWATTIFIVGFVPLRSVAGGFHAKTHFRCFLVLMATYSIFLALIFSVPAYWCIFINVFCVCIAVMAVWLLSPIEDRNKPLNTEETKCFKKRSRIAILFYAGAILAGTVFLKNRIEVFCLAMGVTSAALSLVTAYIKSRIAHNSLRQ